MEIQVGKWYKFLNSGYIFECKNAFIKKKMEEVDCEVEEVQGMNNNSRKQHNDAIFNNKKKEK